MSDSQKKKTKKSLSRRQFIHGIGAVAAASVFSKYSHATDKKIVRAAIHPAIGVARVGNSKEAYFIGPEVVVPPLTKEGESRHKGALKRQAARFRIYGFNKAGRVVREITPKHADIQWSVHLANKKAAWYRFIAASDLPEARGMALVRRNPGARRKSLVIDPGERSIKGVNQNGAQYRFTGGRFMGVPVDLGEIRTDDEGRLIVLGGYGKSASPTDSTVYDPTDADTFNNAAGWYDDTSDGPVTATVSIEGQKVPVDPSWVFVGPPNYTPDIIGFRTLYDLLVETYISKGMMRVPETTSFSKDILPLFRRLSNLQWVNKGFAIKFGKGGEFDFEDPKLLKRLADKTENRLRQSVYNHFRLPSSIDSDKGYLWPAMYGDSFGSFEDSPSNNFIVSEITHLHLQRWAEGKFAADGIPPRKETASILKVDLQKQPAELDKAALHFCLADAFHPGCELTWPMRNATIYSAPFRIKHRRKNTPEPDYGDSLSTAEIFQLNGPLHAQGPGDLSKWMAVPWQGDTIFCRSGYEPDSGRDPMLDPYLPTFWPARVPNHVLTEEVYDYVKNTQNSKENRLVAFNTRDSWVRAMRGSPVDHMKQMIRDYGKIGVIEARPGIKGDPDFPEVMFVESLGVGTRSFAAPRVATARPRSFSAKSLPEKLDPIKEAGWESKKQLEEFRTLRGLNKK